MKNSSIKEVTKDDGPAPTKREEIQIILKAKKEIPKGILKENNNRIPKPKNSYLMFSLTVREKITKDNPGLKGKEIVSRIGEEWRALPNEEKKKFVELSLKDQERYRKEMEAAGKDVKQNNKRKNPVDVNEKSKKPKKKKEEKEEKEDSSD